MDEMLIGFIDFHVKNKKDTIYHDVPKENFYFGIGKGATTINKIPLSLLEIDSVFSGGEFRITVNALPINSLYFQKYYQPGFEVTK